MAKIKVGIVVADALLAKEIVTPLNTHGYSTTEPAANYAEALTMMAADQPDILIIDIELKGSKDGLDLAQKIKEQYGIPLIALTSGTDAAISERAKELAPQAYLARTIGKGELYASIEIALHNYATGEHVTKVQEKPDYFVKDALFVRQGPVYHKIKLDDILYMESIDVMVNVHSTVGKMQLRNNLEHFLGLLDAEKFFRVHKAYAVNVEHVDSVSENSLLIKNKEIPVGKTYHEELMKFLELE